MATGQFLRMMARYNRWQNGSLFDAARSLTDAVRRDPRGGFWGGIHNTLSHIYWGDRIWLSRFEVAEPPQVPLTGSASFVEDWDTLVIKRQSLDATIVDWADGYTEGPISGSLTWYSGAAGREVTAPLTVILPHIFNHQTHHRGQVHAMLTAAGARPADTDLFLMPTEMWTGVERAA